MTTSYVKVEVYIPEEYVPDLRESLNEGGYLREGAYDSVMAVHKVTGSWRPLEGARPFEGRIGELCTSEEVKAEFRCRRGDIGDVERIVRSIHPYEVPVINFIPLLDPQQP